MLQPTAVPEIAERYRKGWSGKGCRSWRGRRDSRRGLGRSRGRYRRAGLGNTGRRRGEGERDCLGSGRWDQGLHGRGDCRLSRSPNVRRGGGRRSYRRGSFRCVGTGWDYVRRRWRTAFRPAPGLVDYGDQNHPDHDGGQPLPSISSAGSPSAAIASTVAQRCTDSGRRLSSPAPVGRPGADGASLAAADAGARRRVIAIPSWSGHLFRSGEDGAESTVPQLRLGMPLATRTGFG